MPTKKTAAEQVAELASEAEEVLGEIEGTAQAGAKSGKPTFANEREELAYYRQQEHNNKLETIASHKADIALDRVRDGIKEDEDYIGQIVERKFEEGFKSILQGDGLRTAIRENMRTVTTGRKTPVEHSEREGSYMGGRAPGTTTQRGEKAGLRGFMLCLARKDYAAILDHQVAGGMEYSQKALAEGRGAGNSTDGPGGGFLVPPEYSTELIDLLYARVVVRAAGATVMPMQSPQFYRPRLSAGSTANYVGENQPMATSQPTFEQFSLNAKILTALVPISNFLLRDSNPSAERTVKENVAKQIALKEDITFLYGVGSNTVPQGILTAAGTQQIAPTAPTTGDPATYNMVVDMETLLDSANVPDERRVYIAHPRLRGALRKITDLYGRPIFSEFDNAQIGSLNPTAAAQFNGKPRATLFNRPFFTSSQIPLGFGTNGTTPTTDLALVEMSEVVIGQMESIEMDASDQATYTDGLGQVISAFQYNETVFRAVLRHDIALDHNVAVVRRQSIQY